MGCFNTKHAGVSGTPSVSQGSLAVIEDATLVEADRGADTQMAITADVHRAPLQALHKHLSKQIRPTVAPRDTAIVNMQCISHLSHLGGSGSNPHLLDPSQVHLQAILAGELALGNSSSSGATLGHGFVKLASMRSDGSGLPRVLYNAQSMPVNLGQGRHPMWTPSRNALQALIISEQQPLTPQQMEPTQPLGASAGTEAADQGQQGALAASELGQSTNGHNGAQLGAVDDSGTQIASPSTNGSGIYRVAGGSGSKPAASLPLPPKPVTQEARLRERLDRLSLVMETMIGDGNCQFRALSNQLFGTQEHHASVRRNVIRHIKEHREEFVGFVGEGFDCYVEAMSRNGTWGDELTLRAACDWYGAVIRCITSEESNWYISYEPLQLRSSRELFVAYISPVHYNALRRSLSLRHMMRNLSGRISGNLPS